MQRILGAGFGLLLLTSSLFAQSPGTVSNVQIGAAFCVDSPDGRTLAQPYKCAELTISCPGTLDRNANLRITEPPTGTPVRGTLLLGMGGVGRGWYEAPKNEPGGGLAFHARDMLDRLNLAGFRIIQRRWAEDLVLPMKGGWIDSSTSLHASACRYATLAHWIYDEPALHDRTSQALCAHGQSGGGSEISYGLSVYGLEQILDLALPTGGPPHGLAHLGCDAGNLSWESNCNSLLDEFGLCPNQAGNHICFYEDRSIRANIDPGFDLNTPPDDAPCANGDLATVRNNNVMYPGFVRDYPRTRVHFLFGINDCGSAAAMGVPYAVSVVNNSTGEADAELVLATGHTVPGSLPGTLRIEEIIDTEDGCRLRH